MGETFYTVLGVSVDADQETIRRAYREQVKDAHPDVSDNPDAGERFKRLTTARDVLVDTDERRRYDQLGHDAYVRRHVETPVWEASQRQAGEGTATTSASTSTGGSTAGGSQTAETSQSGTSTSTETTSSAPSATSGWTKASSTSR
jgi:DnaJ-class molecular chaperone